MIEIPTLAEYLAPRMKKTQKMKRKLVEQHYIKSGDKPVVCSMIVGCSERWAYQVIKEIKKPQLVRLQRNNNNLEGVSVFRLAQLVVNATTFLCGLSERP